MAITKIGTPDLFDFSATNTALQLPTGTTAQRPTSPSAGEWRFNTTLKYVEYWDGGAWRQIDTEAGPNPDDFPSQNFNVNTYIGNGATQAIDAKFNEAANFNGSSSKIDLPNLGISGAGVRTISAWINVNSLSAAQTIFQFGASAAGERFGFAINTAGKLYVEYYGRDAITSSAQITTGSWFNVAVTYNGGAIETATNTQIYVNGSAVAMSTTGIQTGAANTADSNYGIGYRRPSTSQYFNGKIDQVRIFNTALPATGTASITTLYAETITTAATLDFPVGAGCIAAYQLDGDASDVGGTYGGVETNIGYTGLRFQADLIWIKSRNAAASHQLFDSVRGVSKVISTESSSSESDLGSHGLTAFNSNGFSVSDIASGGNGVNGASGGTYSGTPPNYVAWCFKSGGAPTATNSAGAGNVPTAGSVKIDGADSTIADAGTTAVDRQTVNTKNGFSITTYTPSGGAYTVSHGFTSAPDLIIVKGVSATEDWLIYNSYSGTGKYLSFNRGGGTEPLQSRSSSFSAVTATTFTDQWTSASLQWVAYCFKNIDGYQRVGTYTGDGNTSGNFVYTTSDGTASGTDGFEPAFLLLKNITTAGTSWLLYDNKRTPTNPIQTALIAGSSGADVTTSTFKINFFTNGFEVTGNGSDINGSGDTFIYLAIAADKDSSVPTQANSFSPTLYTGNGGTQNIYTPFAPDFTWVKQRTGSAANHLLFDSIRGAYKQINSNQSYAETDRTSVDKGLTSFNSNGFTVKDTSAGDYEINGTNGGTYSGDGTYVSWNWKAGGLPTINNNGDITSLVSANVAGGFSIVKYTAGSATNQSIGHGLTNLTPKLVLIKKTSGTEGWIVWYEGAGTDNWLELNSSNQKDTGAGWGGVPTSTVVHLQDGGAGRSSANGASYIAYCFADITGYQKVGSYIGNGSTTGPIETTGFEPRYLLIKSADNSSTNWIILDKARTPNNPLENDLKANLSSVEQTGTGNNYPQATTSATGFQVNTTDGAVNGSGTYIYLAIA